MSPCARSMEKWRKAGWFVEHTEHWDHFAKRRKDLLGFADWIALTDGVAVLGQSTSRDNISARIKKINSLDSAARWRTSGGRIVVEGWDKFQGKWRVKSIEV